MQQSDKDGNGPLSFDEFRAAVASFAQLQAPAQQVAAGPSTDSVPKADQALLQMLHGYLNENEDVLREYFEQADQDKNGEVGGTKSGR